MAWWLNPDRHTERRDRMENRGCSDLSTTVSTDDGVRVDVLRYTDTKGWGHEVRSEMRVGSDGERLASEGGSYVTQVVETYTAPVYGFKLIHTRNMATDFEGRGNDLTEIIGATDDRIRGGTRKMRQGFSTSIQDVGPSRFQEQIERCEADLSGSLASDDHSPRTPLVLASPNLLDAPAARDFWLTRGPRWRVALGLTLSVGVLAGIILFLFVGGSSQKVPNQVELIGSGHSVRFSESAVTIHDADGACPSHSNRGFLFWLNETDTTQSVIGIDPNPSGGGIIGLLPNQSVGTCNQPGTYDFGVQSSPGARLVVTVDTN